jgi:2-polyprenyl-3-methyl-5-hydroxy-6-metoxy-1,4-benzoquinol methylase
MKIEKCLCCEGEIKSLINYGEMPLANNYNVKERFPLEVMLCKNCNHIQLSEAVDPDILFKDYPYMSGLPKTSIKYFKDFAENTLRYFPEAKSVLDIACNDGAQLDSFKELGLNTFGVDPAENLVPIARNKGHHVVCSKMEEYDRGRTFDIITAQNVVAHTSTPDKFLLRCKEVMSDSSYLFIATSQADMVVNAEYDTLYHEHISYFNTNSMKELLTRVGLFLVDVYTVPMHGTSYVFVVKTHPEDNPVTKRLLKEKDSGLFEDKTYQKWVELCKEQQIKKKEEIEEYRKNGYLIVGCAAAAKGITFLNMTGTQVDLIVDTTPSKWYNSVCNTTIFPFEYLRSLKQEKILFIILAWNFKSEIVENIIKFRKNENDKFITTYQNN